MAVKNLLNFSTPIASAISASDTTVVLKDSALENLKSHLQDDDDYTYMTLHNGSNVEVVKVFIEDDEVFIERAKDGTSAVGFPEGSCMMFQITESYLTDFVCSMPEDCLPTTVSTDCGCSDCNC